MQDEQSGETQRRRSAGEPHEASGGALTTHGVLRCLTEDEPALRRNGCSQVTPHTRQTCVPRRMASRSLRNDKVLGGDEESFRWGCGHLDNTGCRRTGRWHGNEVDRHGRQVWRRCEHARGRGTHAWTGPPHEDTTGARQGDEPCKGPQREHQHDGQTVWTSTHGVRAPFDLVEWDTCVRGLAGGNSAPPLDISLL
jgi:hypothetical protein